MIPALLSAAVDVSSLCPALWTGQRRVMLQNYTQGACGKSKLPLKELVLPVNRSERKTPSFGLNSSALHKHLHGVVVRSVGSLQQTMAFFANGTKSSRLQVQFIFLQDALCL